MASQIGNARELVQWLFGQPEDKIFEIRERKQRRSLTQNAYYWVLNNKLADALRMDRQELHFHMLKSYGECEVFTVLEKVPLGDYFKYAEVFAHGHLNGKDYKHVRIYKPSSKMDSKEFARLLDGMVQECEQQGIPTMTPNEIAGLKFIEPKEIQ